METGLMKKHGYSQAEVARETCIVPGCNKPAAEEFRICATKAYHPICVECDLTINRMVAIFAFGREKGEKLYAKYRRMTERGTVPSDPQRTSP